MERQCCNVLSSVGLLILRLGIGGFMIAIGYQKLHMLLDGQYIVGDPIGLGPKLSMIGIVIAEFVCPIFLILGLGTRIAALPAAFAMGVAAFVAHGPHPWVAGPSGPSKQGALMFMIPFLALVFTGAGTFSLDHLIASKWRKRT